MSTSPLRRGVLISGATGFLGRSLIATLLSSEVDKIVGFSRRWVDTEALLAEYSSQVASGRLVLYNGDVRDERFLRSMPIHPGQKDAADYWDIIHAAAYKHIPLAETNIQETISTNIDGTRNMLHLRHLLPVRNFVFISTDKACDPINLYGWSKAIAAQMTLNSGGTVLRFGNVWGSTGSIVTKYHEIMQQDLRDNLDELETNPVLKVTDPSMTRYYFPRQEAVEYVLYALQAGLGPVMLVPDLKSATAVEIAGAFSVAYLRGIDIEEIGRRRGEKIHEAMISTYELETMAMKRIAHGQEAYWAFSPDPDMWEPSPRSVAHLRSSKNTARFTSNELVDLVRGDIPISQLVEIEERRGNHVKQEKRLRN